MGCRRRPSSCRRNVPANRKFCDPAGVQRLLQRRRRKRPEIRIPVRVGWIADQGEDDQGRRYGCRRAAYQGARRPYRAAEMPAAGCRSGCSAQGPHGLHPQMHGGRLADADIANPLGFVGLGPAVVLSAAYFLNRGVLVGSRIETAKLSDAYPVPFYKKHCRYLFFNGIQQVWTASESTRRRRKKAPVRSLKSEPVIHRRRKPSEPPIAGGVPDTERFTSERVVPSQREPQ